MGPAAPADVAAPLAGRPHAAGAYPLNKCGIENIVDTEAAMAKRNRTSFQKRNRERRKAEKAAKKRERREQRTNVPSQIAGVDSFADDADDAVDAVGPVTQTIDAETSAKDEPT